MIPILSHFFNDYESLHEYNEARACYSYVSDNTQIFRRLIALERRRNPLKSDSYYEGLFDYYIPKYSSLCDLLWKMPLDLSTEYLCRIQDLLMVKPERFEGWSNLLCQYPPSFVIAGSLLPYYTNELLKQSGGIIHFKNKYLKQFQHTLILHPHIPDLNFFVQKNRGLKDLHIHLNGTTETDVVWNFLIYHPERIVLDFRNSFSKQTIRKHIEQLIPHFTPEKLYSYVQDIKSLRQELITKLAINNEIGHTSFHSIYHLWGDFTRQTQLTGLQEEILFNLFVMSDLRKYQQTEMASRFHHYLLIKGLLHQFLVMQHSQIGFSQFQLLTYHKIRDGVEKYYKDRFMQLAGSLNFPYINSLEGRFSPKGSTIENSKIVTEIINGFENARRTNALLSNVRLSLIAHFIKVPENSTDRRVFIRHRALRNDLKKKSLALIAFKNHHQKGDYVMGIDAAANEMHAGPEVFAQTYRYLRKAGITHFTYHVGEDFHHLLSGLRSIVEAVLFLDLQQSDRLGHCTAVGISPTLWRERVGDTCYLSQGEWLDNLVFVWRTIKESQNQELQSLLLNLENEISEYSHKIYGKCYPPYIFSKAWELRKYDPMLYLNNHCNNYDSWNMVDSDEEIKTVETSLSDKDIKELMIAYHAASYTKNNPRDNYDKTIEIKTNELFSSKQLETLQYIVLQKLASKGIVIETLPTSNIRISYYKEFKEHHVGKWLNRDNVEFQLPPIVVGTDDPGIFMTNIYNEYAHIYLSLGSLGWQSQNRYDVMSDIHRFSDMYEFKK